MQPTTETNTLRYRLGLPAQVHRQTREWLAKLGVRTLEELIGRTDHLEILHSTAAADLAEVELTLQNILKGTGTYISELN